jgi:hypothetical protein
LMPQNSAGTKGTADSMPDHLIGTTFAALVGDPHVLGAD